MEVDLNVVVLVLVVVIVGVEGRGFDVEAKDDVGGGGVVEEGCGSGGGGGGGGHALTFLVGTDCHFFVRRFGVFFFFQRGKRIRIL